MNTKVTEQGVLIPKQWLKYADEVEIRFTHEMILIIPIKPPVNKITQPLSRMTKSPFLSSLSKIPTHDPIFSLGKNPIDDELKDVSVNHDKYIYG